MRHYAESRCFQCHGSHELGRVLRRTYLILDRGEPLSDKTFCCLPCVEIFVAEFNRFRPRRFMIDGERASAFDYHVDLKVEKGTPRREASEMFSGN